MLFHGHQQELNGPVCLIIIKKLSLGVSVIDHCIPKPLYTFSLSAYNGLESILRAKAQCYDIDLVVIKPAFGIFAHVRLSYRDEHLVT